MKITKMTLKWFIFSAFGFLLGIEQAYAACEVELEAYIVARKPYIKATAENLGKAYVDPEQETRRWYKENDYEGMDKSHSIEEIQSIISEKEGKIESYKKDLNNEQATSFSRIFAQDSIRGHELDVCLLQYVLNKRTGKTNKSYKSKSSTQTQSEQSANNNAQTTSNNDTSSNTKPLTKAQLKTQKAEQQAQQDEQQAQQATQVAQEHQTKANQKRQGKRRRHEPENEAHKCISPDFGGLYGGMENTCNFKVWYTYCGYHPTENSWLTGMNCEKQSFGSDEVGPGKQDAAHTHGVEKLFWFACKDPAWPVDVEFVDGDIKGRCHTVGGGSD